MQILRKKRRPIQSAARLQKIVRVFAKYGFENFAHRAKLGRFLPGKLLSPSVQHYTTAERLRMAFEQLGPTFIKLGQLLSTRPDLVSAEVSEEFKKLQDTVSLAPFSAMEPILKEHFGGDLSETFSHFDKEPIGAASIAQVYKATLKNGDPVVLKVQRPRVSEVIEKDVQVLYTLSELLERYVPESRLYNPVGIVDEFVRVLDQETNFVIEANNMSKFQTNFQDIPEIKIPKVYESQSGIKVLVMEKLEGIPLIQSGSLEQEGIDREEILRIGLRAYMKMIFQDGFFHGDLHGGNLLILPGNQIGLIDFGVVGRLNRKTQNAVVSMLLALASEDYERLAYEYIDMAPYTNELDEDLFARELRDLMAPYHGLSSEHIDSGKVLLDSTSIASKYQLSLPPELILFFKSIMAVEGMGKLVLRDFDFLADTLDFVEQIVKSRYSPKKMAREALFFGRETQSLVAMMPRQLKRLVRRLNSRDFTVSLEVRRLQDVRRAIEVSSNILFLGLIIGSLILSASVIMVFDAGPRFWGAIPLFSAIGYGIAIFLSMIAVANYIRK